MMTHCSVDAVLSQRHNTVEDFRGQVEVESLLGLGWRMVGEQLLQKVVVVACSRHVVHSPAFG